MPQYCDKKMPVIRIRGDDCGIASVINAMRVEYPREEKTAVMATSVSSIETAILRKIYAAIDRPPIRLALGRGPEVVPANTELFHNPSTNAV